MDLASTAHVFLRRKQVRTTASWVIWQIAQRIRRASACACARADGLGFVRHACPPEDERTACSLCLSSMNLHPSMRRPLPHVILRSTTPHTLVALPNPDGSYRT